MVLITWNQANSRNINVAHLDLSELSWKTQTRDYNYNIVSYESSDYIFHNYLKKLHIETNLT